MAARGGPVQGSVAGVFDRPRGVVFQGVMRWAQKCEVIVSGLAAILPILRVINVALHGATIATGKAARPISHAKPSAELYLAPCNDRDAQRAHNPSQDGSAGG